MKECMAVILAAGEGTRMKSRIPKVLHEAAGRSMLEWVVNAVREVDAKKCVVVCGRGMDEIKERLGDGASYAEQAERKGSGHAVMCAARELEGFTGYTLIIAGDMPLLRAGTVRALVDAAEKGNYACTMLTAQLEDPYGYGRILRNELGDVTAIVEEKDATEEQREIKEVNASCYCVCTPLLLECLKEIKPANAQGEYYLTDIVGLLNARGEKVGAYIAEDAQECMGVNDRVQLAQISEILRGRILEQHMRNGVTLIDPKNTYIGADCEIGQDTVIYPNVTLEGNTRIGEDVTLYPGSRIKDSAIGSGTQVQNSVVLNAEIGEHSTVGPNAYVRPDSHIGSHCRIGDFVEIKNSTIGDGTKVSHLTYIGDSDFGKGINVGCGVVVVNYDGKNKFRTSVGDDAFIGCNTNLISPVSVGGGVYIAAGSTITEDIPDNAFAIARSRQTVKTDWKDKRK
ncbi:bifunctional UDP-N-acetylglucosamine diphosphorylase/glucosamine-1-phosphate N-acetyltransferase GlmU [Christensenella intestinihominis]|uniref:bifunctional UDP-N-acetylglucosamine diphosphorylase/glucosamine-1-phosphate N-acetyltransferase GlmU n=1 Tax=Christensenella intestinihominis TaxID=1851429 RepID=UPI000834EF70|nr:bifunctional UDP-N-acetylglucosamine diphosphorylase/glucosamine-1-phosphate N-acetyltransferase GlmU [Christensenella intestinihominis]